MRASGASSSSLRSGLAIFSIRRHWPIGTSPAVQGAAWLRREGLYSSHLAEWRRDRRAGSLKALAKPRGPKGRRRDPPRRRLPYHSDEPVEYGQAGGGERLDSPRGM